MELQRIPLHPGANRQADTAQHHEVRHPDSEVIRDDAGNQHVWFIRSGILRLQRHGLHGRRQILSLFFPGEIIGFEGEFREGTSVETATLSSLCRIDRRGFETLLTRSEDLRRELLRQKQEQLDRLHWLTWSLGALGPEQRLCALLALSSTVMPYQVLPDGSGVLSMLLPRKDIADLLATTVETVCRCLHKLSQTDVIEIRDPAHFRIVDLNRLIALGQIEGHFDRMTRRPAPRRAGRPGAAIQGGEHLDCLCGA